jgi:hypothetical protein
MPSVIRGVFRVLLVLVATTPLMAQEPTQQSAPGARRLQYGVRFGPSFTSLTSPETFDPGSVARAFEPTMNFGGFFNLQVRGPWSFQPEILFASKGHRTNPEGAPPIDNGVTVKPPAADDVILIRYLEFPLLLRLSKQTRETTSLYLIGGPALALMRYAEVRKVVDPGVHQDIDDQVEGTDLSYVLGAGLQHKRWLVDARLTMGVKNIATVEPRPGDVKTSAFSVLLGVRF